MDFAFSFIIRNGGLDTESDYKYKAADGVCNIAKEKRRVVTIDSYEDVPPMDESSLKKVRADPFVMPRLPAGCPQNPKGCLARPCAPCCHGSWGVTRPSVAPQVPRQGNPGMHWS